MYTVLYPMLMILINYLHDKHDDISLISIKKMLNTFFSTEIIFNLTNFTKN